MAPIGYRAGLLLAFVVYFTLGYPTGAAIAVRNRTRSRNWEECE
jgi:hypothetical protein